MAILLVSLAFFLDKFHVFRCTNTSIQENFMVKALSPTNKGAGVVVILPRSSWKDWRYTRLSFLLDLSYGIRLI